MPAARRACRWLQGRKLVTARTCLIRTTIRFGPALGRWATRRAGRKTASCSLPTYNKYHQTKLATSHRARLVRVAMCVKKPCPTCGKAGLSRFTWAG